MIIDELWSFKITWQIIDFPSFAYTVELDFSFHYRKRMQQYEHFYYAAEEKFPPFCSHPPFMI